MPPGSIRFIHDAATDADKAKVFAACRNGHVAVLIGSTEKMGVGTNIQTRAVHLMDLDAAWRPADVAQSHGRILRQGNQHPEISITQVITENSFDAYMWQTLERKAAFIDQIMSGRGVNRTTGDIGDATLNAAEAKALSSGNPLLLDPAVAEQELARLTRLERAHATTQHTLATTLTHSQQGLQSTKARIERLHQMAARTVPTHGTLFALTLASSGRSITDRAEAAAHLDRALAGLREAPVAIGTLGGHHLTASAQTRWDTHGSPWRHTTWSITGDADLHITTTWRIGSDGRPVDLGTIARLEHLIAGIPTAIQHATKHSEELQNTIAQARRPHGHPFTFAAELASARARYADLTKQLTEQTNQTPAWEVVAPSSAARPATDPPPLDPGRGRGGPAI